MCCGYNFYGKIPLYQVHSFQKKRAAKMPCQQVAVYCVSFIKSMPIGGKTARYMVDLILNQPTDPQDLNLDSYHQSLADYIECH